MVQSVQTPEGGQPSEAQGGAWGDSGAEATEKGAKPRWLRKSKKRGNGGLNNPYRKGTELNSKQKIWPEEGKKKQKVRRARTQKRRAGLGTGQRGGLRFLCENSKRTTSAKQEISVGRETQRNQGGVRGATETKKKAAGLNHRGEEESTYLINSLLKGKRVKKSQGETGADVSTSRIGGDCRELTS